MLRYLVCLLLLLLGVSLSGACTWDSELTSADCLGGVNVSRPTKPPPVVTPGRPPGDRPLESEDPCAPILKQSQPWTCALDKFDVFTARHTLVGEQFPAWNEDAAKELAQKWAEYNSVKSVVRYEVAWCKEGFHQVGNGVAEESECTVTFPSQTEGGADEVRTWRGEVSAGEAEDRCDRENGWPESGAKCSGCRALEAIGDVGPHDVLWYCDATGTCSGRAQRTHLVFDAHESREYVERTTREQFDGTCRAESGTPNCTNVTCQQRDLGSFETRYECTSVGTCARGGVDARYEVSQTWRNISLDQAMLANEFVFKERCKLEGGAPRVRATICEYYLNGAHMWRCYADVELGSQRWFEVDDVPGDSSGEAEVRQRNAYVAAGATVHQLECRAPGRGIPVWYGGS